MNILQQIHVKLLILACVASSCLATEKKPYYESIYDPKDLFHVEDYHADLVLGMLPEIKSSIRGFRKRNFTTNDIENMYQTLTIFWPVVRKYLHLKDELVDKVPSQSNENSTQISDNEIGQDQLSHESSLPYKNDQLSSPQTKSVIASTINHQRAIANPVSSISARPKNKPNSPSTQQNSNRRNFGVKIKRIRPSLPVNDNKRNLQRMYPNRNIQSKTTSSQSSTTTRRPLKPTSNRPLSTTTRRLIKPSSNRPQPTTTRRPLKLTSQRPLSTTGDRPLKHTSSRPISRPIPSSTTSSSIRRTTSRSYPSVFINSDTRNPPKHLDNKASNKSAADSFKTPVSDAMSYYRGFSNILKLIGSPIDLSDVTS